MTDRHEAAMRAALAEVKRLHTLSREEGTCVVAVTEANVTRIVEAALAAADAHDGAVLCSDGWPFHDFKGQRYCSGCGWAGIFADKADQ